MGFLPFFPFMPAKRKISLIYFVICTLLLVGMVPLVLTGWFLSERSGRELRIVENRYQIQLVQEKARQIEMFAQRHHDVAKSVAKALELINDTRILSSPQSEEKLSETLRENPDVVALFVQPTTGEPLSLFRPTLVTRAETEEAAMNAVEHISGIDSVFEGPQYIGQKSEPVVTIATPVTISGQRVASVVSIVSL
ncbi:MAG: hypothetical protein ABI539_05720, partial [Acidobacteriota bacterium]